MKIKYLRVSVDGVRIRDIGFRDGLNLVVNQRGVGRTGNSIGKTTLARLVDYLFGGGVESIYIDEEFGKPNLEIERLLTTSSALKYSFSASGQSWCRLSDCVDGEVAQHARPVGR